MTSATHMCSSYLSWLASASMLVLNCFDECNDIIIIAVMSNTSPGWKNKLFFSTCILITVNRKTAHGSNQRLRALLNSFNAKVLCKQKTSCELYMTYTLEPQARMDELWQQHEEVFLGQRGQLTIQNGADLIAIELLLVANTILISGSVITSNKC